MSFVYENDLVEPLVQLAIAAGAEILRVRAAGLEAREKADSSPVTEADEAAERVILAGLAKLAPSVPAIAEESVAAGRVPQAGARFWLVDPLDGTKEFIRGRSDFTVNIGLIEAAAPVFGVVYAPAKRRVFYTEAPDRAVAAEVDGAGEISGRRAIAAGRPTEKGHRIVASKSHRNPETDAFIAKYRLDSLVSAGSSLKFCLVAAGEADLYPRLGPTMEWDTAAGDAVLRASGGRMTALDGQPFLYGKPGFRNGHFLARGRD